MAPGRTWEDLFPQDVQSLIAGALSVSCDPLCRPPVAAAAVAGVSHALRELLRPALEEMRAAWTKSGEMATSLGMTREQVESATVLSPASGFAAGHAVTLGELMQLLRGLLRLDLAHKSLRLRPLRPLLSALDRAAAPRLQFLVLDGNLLDDEFCGALAAVLLETDSLTLASLKELHLAHNRITSRGIAALSDALSFGALPQCEALSLASNRVGDAGVAALVRSSMGGGGGLRKLRRLFLHSNLPITRLGLRALSAALWDRAALPALQVLHLPALSSHAQAQHPAIPWYPDDETIAASSARGVDVVWCFDLSDRA